MRRRYDTKKIAIIGVAIIGTVALAGAVYEFIYKNKKHCCLAKKSFY